MTESEPYKGRELLLEAQQIWGLRSLINQSLRRSNAYRAMIIPIVLGILLTALARYTLYLGISGVIAAELSFTLGVGVFWPAALAAALGADLIKKEHKFQSGLIG
jgi:hypothetical protein